MAGFISQMFPEFGDSLPGKALKSLGRGVQSVASAPLDLASLPFTMTGVIKPEDAIGSTAWFDKKDRGMFQFIEKQKGSNPYEQAFLDTMELAPALAAPAKLGGVVGAGKAAKYVPDRSMAPPASLGGEAADEIPTTRGQRNQNNVQLAAQARLAADEKFSQRAADFGKYQNDKAKSIVEGFARSIGGKNTDAELGKRIQFNFNTWFDSVQANYKKRTTEAFDKVKNNPAADQPLPESTRATDKIKNFVDSELRDNSPPGLKAAMDELMADSEKIIGNPSLTVKEMQQHLEQANKKYSQAFGQSGPYDTVTAGSLSRVQAVYKDALTTRLDDAIANGPNDIAQASSDLKRANRLYGITIENQKNLQKQAINRFLGAREDEFLNPEAIADKFKKLSPTQRQFFTKIANKVDPEMIPAMQRHIFDDLYKAGATKGQGSEASAFDMRKFLTKVEDMKTNNPELLNFAMGDDPAFREQFEKTLNNMKDAVNTGSTVSQANSHGVANIAAGAAGALINQPGAARAGAGVMQALKDIAVDKEQLFNHLFHGGPVPDGAVTTLTNKAGGVSKKILDGLDNAVLGVSKDPAMTGLRQGVNAEVAEGVNANLQGMSDNVGRATTPLDSPIDPALLEGWETAPVEPSSPVSDPQEGSIDPALLEGW